jgi:hypothetical protein
MEKPMHKDIHIFTHTHKVLQVGMIAMTTFFTLGIFLIPGLLTPHIAQAQSAQNFSALTVLKECTTKECRWPEFLRLLNEILKFMVYIAIAGATIAIALGGLSMVMNMGDTGKISEGKKRIKNAIIGLVLTLAAWLIMKFLLDLIGVESWVRSFIG